jgi:shikimate dehydrogenase
LKRFGLIGFPLTHSFSKKYFTEKFAREGLDDHTYDLFPLRAIDEFPAVIKANPDLVGLNVTIPYKQAILQYLHESFLPGNMQATNCIKILNGRLSGYNTDVIGFERSFTPLLQPHHTQALVLGNGGATAAVIYVLQNLGIGYNIVSRKLHDGSSLQYEMLDARHMDEHPVIINTTPLGMFPDVDVCPPIPYEHITAAHYLFDLVYNPPLTAFLKKGAEMGAVVKNGYDMLEIQAEESWKIWNG